MNPSPFYKYVPTDPQENLAWRVRMRKAALKDREVQDGIRQACFDDPLFFFASMMWVYEPRATLKVMPFCLWPTQVKAILAMDAAIDETGKDMEQLIDLVLDKSRAQGGSWMPLGVITRRFLRDEMFAAGLVSRNMACVDNSNDPDSLMWKIDFTLKLLPWWMLPVNFDAYKDRSLANHAWTNSDNGSTIIGWSATGDVGSGGRKTVIFFDELAKFDEQQPGAAEDAMNSTQHITNCRFFVSTHKGDSGVYYNMVFGDNWKQDGEIFPYGGSGIYRNASGGVKIILDWRDNPTQNKLAYRCVGGSCFPEKPENSAAVRLHWEEMKRNGNYDKLKRRGFIKDGRLRSPWYDRKCLQQGVMPRGVAQELDRDPRGTVGKLFNTDVLDKMVRINAKPPLWEGKPVIVDGDLNLQREEGGPLKLWFNPGLNDECPPGKYVAGCDIGTGSGGEWAIGNSVICAANAMGGQQVLEYTDNSLPEVRFARLAVAVCKWLGNALLIWEAQGPTGKRFANEVMKEANYPNVWLRPKENVRTFEKTQQPGWVNNRTTAKADLFEDLWVAWDDEMFIPRSEEFLKECGGWEWNESGDKVIYRGNGHGDRAIAGGLCWKGMKDILTISLDKSGEQAQDSIRYGTLAWRIEQEKVRRSRFSDEIGYTIQELLET